MTQHTVLDERVRKHALEPLKIEYNLIPPIFHSITVVITALKTRK